MSHNIAISHLSLIMTDDCNFRCNYCPQRKEKVYMSKTMVKKGLTFFYPFLKKDDPVISLYGGEPLLAFSNIKHTVSLFNKLNQKEKKKIQFVLTTNGSLLTEEMLEFFQQQKFMLVLSYDGLAHDAFRKKGSASGLTELIRQIDRYPGIHFATHSVFTPATVESFSASIRQIAEAGSPDILYTLAVNEPWENNALTLLQQQLDKTAHYLADLYHTEKLQPVRGFQLDTEDTPKGTFKCDGARSRMAVAPDGKVWGCFVFHSQLKDRRESDDYTQYSFGSLDEFIKNHETIYPKILKNYLDLRQDCFFTQETEEKHCFMCDHVEECSTCPVSASHLTGMIGSFPPWVCRMSRLESKARELFRLLIN